MKTEEKILPHSGPAWNFSLNENLASPSLQDGPQSGIIICEIQHIAPAATDHIAPAAARPTILYIYLIIPYLHNAGCTMYALICEIYIKHVLWS